jgi:hypothetical protein
MSDRKERFDAIEKNYLDALRNKRIDLAATTSESEIIALTRNLNQAEEIYLDAVNAALAKQGQAIEDAYQASLAANRHVQDSRAALEQVATRITKMTTATQAAKTLAQIA